MENMTSARIETPFGAKSLSVAVGDVSSWQGALDVMTVSAFCGSYRPVPNTMMAALQAQNISVSALADSPALDLRKLSHVWLSEPIHGSSLPIGRVGCIEMLSMGDLSQAREAEILSSIRAYFRMLDLASVSGVPIHSLALPILGSGEQKIALELIALPMLNECIRYLRQNEDIREITIFTRSAAKAYQIAKALDSSYTLTRDKTVAQQHSRSLPLAFISYADSDRNVADHLCAKLEAAGIPVWYAPRNVDTNDYASSIVSAISRCTHFIVIISRSSLRSEHVLNEVDLAFQELGRKIRLCPLKLDDESLGPAFKYYLSRQHWMEVSLPPLDTRLAEFAEKLSREMEAESLPSGRTLP